MYLKQLCPESLLALVLALDAHPGDALEALGASRTLALEALEAWEAFEALALLALGAPCY